MTDARVAVVKTEQMVWRIGFDPDPWTWQGWEWASDGRFPGRWDDRDGIFRTLYVGSSPLACLLEVLATFRRDLSCSNALDTIDEDPADAEQFCAVTSAQTIATLYPVFIDQALRLGLRDFDAASLKDGRPRALTQAVATYLFATTDVDGLTFASRHGDDLQLWALFERGGDERVSARLANPTVQEITTDGDDLGEALRMLGLVWSDA